MEKSCSLTNSIRHTNCLVRSAIFDLSDQGRHNLFVITDPSITGFLSGNTLPSTQAINRIASSSGVFSALPPSQEDMKVASTGVHAPVHCFENMFWMSMACRMMGSLGGHNQGNKLELFFVGLLLAVLASISVLMVGASVAAMCINAIKVHLASRRIHACTQTRSTLLAGVDSALSTSREAIKEKIAAITSSQACRYLSSAYRQYRLVRIAFLASSILFSLSLFALIAGAVLAIFFSTPGSAAITAAIMGCSIGGAASLITSGISYMLSIIYANKQYRKIILKAQRGLLCAVASDQLLYDMDGFMNNLISQRTTDMCLGLSSSSSLITTRHIIDVGTQHPHPTAPPQEDLPPSYSEAVMSNEIK